MLKSVIGYAKSTIGIFQHSAQWLSFDFSDQVIKLSVKNDNLDDDSAELKDKVAIYFIHGTGDQACCFQAMAKQLKEDGLSRDYTSMHLVAFDGRYQGKGIDDFADQLLEKIKSNGHSRVVLVGHSRGALIGAYLNEYLAHDAKINVLHCISICGPFRGSYLALQAFSIFSSSVGQMSKGSYFLKALRYKINSGANSPYTFVIAKQDNIVPNRSGYISEYVKNNPKALYSLPDDGHLSAMASTRLCKYLRNLMNQAVDLELGLSPALLR